MTDLILTEYLNGLHRDRAKRLAQYDDRELQERNYRELHVFDAAYNDILRKEKNGSLNANEADAAFYELSTKTKDPTVKLFCEERLGILTHEEVIVRLAALAMTGDEKRREQAFSTFLGAMESAGAADGTKADERSTAAGAAAGSCRTAPHQNTGGSTSASEKKTGDPAVSLLLDLFRTGRITKQDAVGIYWEIRDARSAQGTDPAAKSRFIELAEAMQ